MSITIRFLRERGDLQWHAIECVLVRFSNVDLIFTFTEKYTCYLDKMFSKKIVVKHIRTDI